ncbi:MAG: cytochrome c [Pseudomonadota bacterium]
MQKKTTFRVPAAVAACSLFLTLSGMPAYSQSYGDAAKGKVFVQSNCARCHAIGLNDDSHMPEAPAFRSLHNRYPIDSLAEAFAEGIVTGHPAMPQFELSIDTINDMLAYMKSLAGPGD